MQILILGGSRNIGHHVAHLLLHSPTTANTTQLTLLLRNELPADDSLTTFVADGRVKIVRGNAMIYEDVVRAWTTAGGRECEAVLYAIGTPEHERSFRSVRPSR